MKELLSTLIKVVKYQLYVKQSVCVNHLLIRFYSKHTKLNTITRKMSSIDITNAFIDLATLLEENKYDKVKQNVSI